MATHRHGRDLLAALVSGNCTQSEVEAALTTLAENPLVKVYAFRGDLLRGLMEIPTAFWARHPALYEEYRGRVRAAALLRRDLPAENRAEFWSPLALTD
jgi:hypothetical protein